MLLNKTKTSFLFTLHTDCNSVRGFCSYTHSRAKMIQALPSITRCSQISGSSVAITGKVSTRESHAQKWHVALLLISFWAELVTWPSVTTKNLRNIVFYASKRRGKADVGKHKWCPPHCIIQSIQENRAISNCVLCHKIN